MWGAHWRHLANTTELCICGGDAALCQITLTTCSMLFYCTETQHALDSCWPNQELELSRQERWRSNVYIPVF